MGANKNLSKLVRVPLREAWKHVEPCLQLIHKGVLDLFRLNAKIGKGLLLGAVVEAFHECRQIHPKRHPLVIAPSLPERMGCIVAFELGFLAPTLDLLG